MSRALLHDRRILRNCLPSRWQPDGNPSRTISTVIIRWKDHLFGRLSIGYF
jgi:hypothetical protein